MGSYQTLLLSVDEVWLKGKNRKPLLNILKQSTYAVVRAFHSSDFSLKLEGPKFVLRSEEGFSQEVIERLAKVPGLYQISLCRELPSDFDAILPAVLEEIEQLPELPKSFRVVTRRTEKGFPMGSMEVSRKVGHLIRRHHYGLPVDMTDPELTVDIRITNERIYVYTKNVKGVGGLPVGTSGHLITLLSGGFDSPVASFLMSRRGCDQTLIFFHAYPFVGDEVKEKILELSQVLSQYQRRGVLFVIPFGEIQTMISEKCRESYRTLFFRRYMLETAQLLGRKINAKGLVTGDALGQVSSQTIENMAAVEKGLDLPVLRPLVGAGKREIIDWARQIGTHDISVRPHDDACSMLAPKNPVIRASMNYWQSFLQRQDFAGLLNEAIQEAEVFIFRKDGEIKTVKGHEYIETLQARQEAKSGQRSE